MLTYENTFAQTGGIDGNEATDTEMYALVGGE